MPATKTPASRRLGQQQGLSGKPSVTTKHPGPRPFANTAKGEPTGKETSPGRPPVAKSSQVRSAPAAGRAPTTTENQGPMNFGDSKANLNSSQAKRTPWTIEAASRVASASARHGDGEVKKGSFAAGAMSAAMKNEHKLKAAK
jgi:hypothetical protein